MSEKRGRPHTEKMEKEISVQEQLEKDRRWEEGEEQKFAVLESTLRFLPLEHRDLWEKFVEDFYAEPEKKRRLTLKDKNLVHREFSAFLQHLFDDDLNSLINSWGNKAEIYNSRGVEGRKLLEEFKARLLKVHPRVERVIAAWELRENDKKKSYEEREKIEKEWEEAEKK